MSQSFINQPIASHSMNPTGSGLAILDQIRGKSKIETDPDQEGWLVSYADLITLLFIFFSIMLSISVVSKAKFELLTQQLNQNSVTSLSELKKQLEQEIQKENLTSAVSTEMTDQGLQVQFNEKVLFALGQSGISPEGAQILEKFSKVLREMAKEFQLAVEGHTDSRPIHTKDFPSNWELSSSRAVNVLHFLAAHGMNENKMMVKAYADTRPLATPHAMNALPVRTAKGNAVQANTAKVEDSNQNLATNLLADPNAKNRRVTLLVF